MTSKKIQIRPKGNGSYADVLHPETSADQVFANDGQNLQDKLTSILTTSHKGAASGVAPLDENSKIKQLYLPSESYFEVRTSDPSSPVTGRIWLRTDL